jgi:hypothetical protein
MLSRSQGKAKSSATLQRLPLAYLAQKNIEEGDKTAPLTAAE